MHTGTLGTCHLHHRQLQHHRYQPCTVQFPRHLRPGALNPAGNQPEPQPTPQPRQHQEQQQDASQQATLLGPIQGMQDVQEAAAESNCSRLRPESEKSSSSSSYLSAKHPSQPSLLPSLLRHLDQHCIPLFLVTGILAGLAQPAWGTAAAAAGATQLITQAVFVASGLQLRQGEAATALGASGSLAFGLASILLLSPLLAVPLLLSASQVLPVKPALAMGTAVFAAMPTTLSSGITMTTAAGGNTAMAILLTVSSNALSVLTLPLLLPALLGPALGGGLQPLQLLQQLVTTVLMPTAIGAAARGLLPGVATAVDGNRRLLVLFNATCLASIPWMQVSKAAQAGLQLLPADLVCAAGLGCALHLGLLAANTWAVQALQLGGADPWERAKLRQALVLQCSQKTLPVAVAMIAKGLGGQGVPETAGLAAISAVAAHLAQVLIDSCMVPVWADEIGRAAMANTVM
ncbi:SBF-like CPA transporter family-domain-containing protein [Haematococcus lacustris]